MLDHLTNRGISLCSFVLLSPSLPWKNWLPTTLPTNPNEIVALIAIALLVIPALIIHNINYFDRHAFESTTYKLLIVQMTISTLPALTITKRPQPIIYLSCEVAKGTVIRVIRIAAEIIPSIKIN